VKALIRRKQVFPLIAALVLTLCHAGCLAASLAETIAVPNGMTTKVSGEKIKHNGVVADVLIFSYPGGPDEIVDFYQTHWRAGLTEDQPGFILDHMQEWQLISRVEQGHLFLVQVRQGRTGGAEGYLSVRSLESFTGVVRLPEKFPALPGSHVVSVTESIDGGRRAKTFIVTNHQSIDGNSRFFVEQASRMGWQNVSPLQQGSEGILRFNTPDSQIDLAMRRSGQGLTVIFINSVDSLD